MIALAFGEMHNLDRGIEVNADVRSLPPRRVVAVTFALHVGQWTSKLAMS
jgi:hypothetical protein